MECNEHRPCNGTHNPVRGLDNRKLVDIVFLDFQNAFDKVPHKCLLLKLKGMGIDGNLFS